VRRAGSRATRALGCGRGVLLPGEKKINVFFHVAGFYGFFITKTSLLVARNRDLGANDSLGLKM